MTPQTDLYDLIQSLSQSEKRYFKVYSQAIGGKESASYIKLFDFLEKMPAYDEKAVKDQFRNERFVRQLSVLKNYLYDLILRSLVHGSREYRPSAELHMHLGAVQLLYEKGLHKSCLKLIKRIKTTATQMEEFGILDSLNDWEGRIVMNEANTAEAIEKAKEQISFLKKRAADLEYKVKAIEVYEYAQNGDLYNQSQRGKIQQTYTGLQKKAPEQTQAGVLGRYYYHTALKMLSKQLKNHDEELIHAKSAMIALESNKEFLEANLRLYLGVLYNYTLALTELKRFPLLVRLVNDKKKLIHQLDDDRHKELKHLGELVLMNVQIILYINGAQPSLPPDAVEVAKKYIVERRKYANAFDILQLCINMMHALFMDKSYKDALYFVNEILNKKQYKRLSLPYAQVRFRELLIHYEMKNHVLAVSLAENLIRLLRRQRQLQRFDLKLINFLKAPDSAKQVTLLRKLLSDLERMAPGATFSIIQDEIPLKEWLQEKLRQGVH